MLTLDRSVQYSTEQVLLEQVAAIGAKGATAIAMDTDTGEIYSMASVRRDDETGDFEVTSGNFAAVDAYEPGSVAKVITIASSLSEGLVTPETSYVVPWRKQYYDDLLKDSHQHPDEVMSVAQILTESSNIGTIFVQQEMGRERHREYMAAVRPRLEDRTRLPRGVAGILKQPEDLWGSERVTVAYGQGVSSTSLQLVAAVNTIANRGTYVAPKLVKATVGPDGSDHRDRPVGVASVVTELAAVQTTEMMRNVVCRGTATRGPGRRSVDRRQDRHGVQGGRQRHLLRRRRQPHLLRQLRRVLPGRGPAGHRARLGRRAAGRHQRSLRRHRRRAGVRRAGPHAHPRTRHRPDARRRRVRRRELAR